MSFLSRFSFSTSLMVLLFGGTACSNTPPTAEPLENPDAAHDSGESQSNADAVGSVPEDMLADEKGVESSTGSSGEATSSDPFGDLKDKDASKTADALAVSEEDGSSSSSSAGSGKMDTYTVKAGDTLMKIAFSIYGDVDRWKDLHELNQAALKSGSALRQGMKIRYEVPVEAFQPDQLAHSYLIKKGDTLAGIADDVYGRKSKYKKLQSYNKRLIKNPNKIFAGFNIFYDITEKEVAEAEARRAQKAAGGGGAPAHVPSVISPPASASPPHVATTTPTAIDNSAVPGPGASQEMPGPPAPQGSK